MFLFCKSRVPRIRTGNPLFPKQAYFQVHLYPIELQPEASGSPQKKPGAATLRVQHRAFQRFKDLSKNQQAKCCERIMCAAVIGVG